MKKFALVLTFIAALSLTVFADVRLPDNMRPKPSQSPTPEPKDVQTPMNISVSPNVEHPILRISRRTLEKLNSMPVAANTDGNSSPSATTASNFNLSQSQTLMSGLFLSLALVFGGVWFARGKSFSAKQKTAVGALVIGFLAASALSVSANVAPPPYKGIDGSLFSDKMRGHYHGASDNAEVEITDENYDYIELIVPDKR